MIAYKHKSKIGKENSMKEVNNSFQLEEAFKEIEDIINQLESDTISLKESISLYGKGAQLVAECKKELTGIEKEMIVINDGIADNPMEDEE